MNTEAEDKVRNMLKSMKEAGLKDYENFKEKVKENEEEVTDYVTGMVGNIVDYFESNDDASFDFLHRFIFQLCIYLEKIGASKTVVENVRKANLALNKVQDEEGYCKFNFEDVFTQSFLKDVGFFVADNTVLYDSDSFIDIVKDWSKNAEEAEKLRKNLNSINAFN